MTEEIIINCAFYKDGVCASPINKTCEYCKNIDVSKCYHKQLKRLEQDSKQLTQWLDEARRNADFWCDKCTSLEQEYKELKEYSKRMENQRENYYKEYNKYRSALEEIRILATKNVSIENFVKIQNKINEVLE